MTIGIIAEDDSDVNVVRKLTIALLKSDSVGFKKFVGNGCGKLRRKCRPWAINLVKQGCAWLIVVHDLDTNQEQDLRRELTEAVAEVGARGTVVLIPKREIEAWLLYDTQAIALAFNEKKLPTIRGNPENIEDPKKFLRELVFRSYRKTYLHTVHNVHIAGHIQIARLKNCRSFLPHVEFSKTLIKALRSSRRRLRS